MTTTSQRPRLTPARRRDLIRVLLGSVLEMFFKAYGAAAALSVALSDSETVFGKLRDGVAAVPNLIDRYRAARYVVDHREQIQGALDYLHTHTPPQAELEAATNRSAETLDGITTTVTGIDAAWESLNDWTPNPIDAIRHLETARQALPSIDQVRDLSETAQQVTPYVDQIRVLTPLYQDNVFNAVDNFASDEITSTVLIMILAFAVAALLGRTVAFWVRRGRPGLIAMALQRLGIRIFPSWYADDPRHSLGDSVYGAAHRQLQVEIIKDPETALDPDTLQALERHFAARRTRPPE